MMGAKWLDFPVQWDTAKAGDDPGILEGYASVWDVVDLQEEIVQRGAFTKNLREWKAASTRRPILLTSEHDNSPDGVIGSLESAEEDARGLRIRARFSSVAKAQDIRRKAVEGHLNGLSIFGPVISRGSAKVGDRMVTVLKEVQLWAVGITGFPANRLAVTSAVKGAPVAAESAPDNWEDDMRAALTIVSSVVRKAAVDALLAAREQVTTDTPVVDLTGETTSADGDSDDPSSYAMSIIGESGPATRPPGDRPSTGSPADLLAPLEIAKAITDLDTLEAELTKITKGSQGE